MNQLKMYLRTVLTALILLLLCSGVLAEESLYVYEVVDGNVHITGYTGSDAVLDIPSAIEGRPVTSLYLKGCGAVIREITLPETIVELADEAFFGLEELCVLEGLEYVQRVGTNAFAGTAVREAVFSDALEYLDVAALASALHLRCVTLPDDVQTYFLKDVQVMCPVEYTLVDGSGEPTLSLIDGGLFTADGKTLIVYPAYNGKWNWKVPAGTEHIGIFAFNGIGQTLFEVVLPDSIVSIDEDAFPNGTSNGVSYTVYCTPGSVSDALMRRYAENGVYMIVRDTADYVGEQLLDDILDACITSDMSSYKKALAIHDWILENCEYDYDMENTTGYEMLIYRTGICNAYAEAFEMLAARAGLSCGFAGNVDHIFNVVRMGDELMYIDCTWDDVQPAGLTRYRYFGFEKHIRHEHYGAMDIAHDTIKPDGNDVSPAYHYYVRQGHMDAPYAEMKAELERQLAQGQTSGQLAYPEDLMDAQISRLLLQAMLEQYAWMDGGEPLAVDFFTTAETPDALCWTTERMPEAPEGFSIDVIGSTVQITGYTGADETVVIPAMIGDMPVTCIGEAAFAQNGSVVSVVLPESVTEIRDNAFYECRLLKSINFPSALSRIGSRAFENCASLQGEIILPEGLELVAAEAFYGCRNITGVYVPGSAEIGMTAFGYCSRLAEATLGEGITRVPVNCFAGDSMLAKVTLPGSLLIIDDYAFNDTALTDIELPAGLQKIGRSPFVYAPLTSLHIPAGVETMDSSLLMNCPQLTAFSIAQDNQNYTCADAVCYSKDMKRLHFAAPCAQNVVIPATVEEISPRAFAFGRIRDVTIPGSVREIPQECFSNCGELEWVRLAEGLESIGKEAFVSSSVPGVDFPASLTNIGDLAFSGCYRLRKVTLPSTISQIGNAAFDTQRMLICGEAGSAAEDYAREHGLTFITPDTAAIVIPPRVQYIEAEAFAGIGCTAVYHNGVLTRVESRAFADNPDLREVHLSFVEYMAPDAFSGSPNVVIVAPENSTASSWAETHGIPWRAE